MLNTCSGSVNSEPGEFQTFQTSKTMEYRAWLANRSQQNTGSGFAPRYMPGFLFDFQQSLVDWAVRKGRAAVFADCGLGKAQPIDEPVLTPNGWKPIGSLNIGDEIIAGDGSVTKVTGVYPQGMRNIAQVAFTDGAVVCCDWDHLWTVQTENDACRGNDWKTLTTREIANKGLTVCSTRSTLQWRIPIVGAVQHPAKTLPIDPYTLGVLIGDGGMSQLGIYVTTDHSIVESLVLPNGVGKVLREDLGNGVGTYALSTGRKGGTPNQLIDALRGLGLHGKRSENKFIPELYLRGSIEQRQALLQGLLDTDGYAGKDGVVQYSTSSTELASNVSELIRSLGGIAYLASKIPTYVYNGEKKVGLKSWTITVVLPNNVSPFRLPRKLNRVIPRTKYFPLRKIQSISFAGTAECVCISVDHPSRLYVTKDHVVTHNTAMQLVWAQNVVHHTNKPVLILTPLAVGMQTVAEAEKFGIEVYRTTSVTKPAIYITNYERLHHYNAADFGGVVCDESSILKNYDGVIKANITEFMRAMPYRLLCTATAAPNDFIELGTSSEALGYLGHIDMLNRFFKHDNNTTDVGHKRMLGSDGSRGWRFKGHAEEPFWKWVCSWARSLRRPSDLGFSDDRFALPKLIEREQVVKSIKPREGFLFALPAHGLSEVKEERRRTIKERCEKAASLVAHTGKSAVCWTHLNDEADLIEKLVDGAVQVSGRDSDEEKEAKFAAFQSGDIRVLVIKPVIGAWGLNWQHCAHMTIFAGYSFEQYYQSIRRCWRFGQKNDVVVENVVSDGEGEVLASRQAKAVRADAMFASLVRHMREGMEVHASAYGSKKVEAPSWL